MSSILTCIFNFGDSVKMKRWSSLFLVCFLVVFVALGCSRATRDESEEVTTTVSVSGSASLIVETVTKDPSPSVLIQFKNYGDTEANNISLNIQAMNIGDDDPLESLSVSPNVSALGANEETWAEAVFETVTEHAEYDFLIISFSWDEEKTKSVTFTERQVISASDIE